MGWEEKTAEKITFDHTLLNKEVVGKIISVGSAGRLEVNTYTLEQSDGKLITFLGTTVLDKILNDEEGSLVKIVYTGDVKTTGGFSVKQFKVYVWEEEKEPVATKVKA